MNYGKEEKYIKNIFTMNSTIDKNVILGFKGRTIIYGAGQTGGRVRILLERHGIKIDYFLDQRGGKNIFIDNIPVFKPDSSIVDKTANVIVAIFNHFTDIVSILNLLRRLGYKKIIPYTKFFLYFSDELSPHYWLSSTDLYESYIPDIACVFSMLQDRASKDLFLSWLRFRVTGDPIYMPKIQADNIYFPPDIPERNRPDNFIDCGACSGDTIRLVRKKFGVLQSIRAFEPDSGNYRQLICLNNKTVFSKDTVLFPCGVWSSTAQLSFLSHGSLDSQISKEGNNKVQCIAIDDCLNGYKPSLIKMDIEGSELEALKGCRHMIMSTQPDLAISVYHKPDHLWKIPLLIKEMVPTYKYFLRSHGANGYDVVFYAHV